MSTMPNIIPMCGIIITENKMTAEELILQSEKELAAQFALADEISEYNQEKVLN